MLRRAFAIGIDLNHSSAKLAIADGTVNVFVGTHPVAVARASHQVPLPCALERIVNKAHRECEGRLGRPKHTEKATSFDSAIVAVPPHLSHSDRQAILERAAMSGLRRCCLVDAAEAACAGYSINASAPGRAADIHYALVVDVAQRGTIASIVAMDPLSGLSHVSDVSRPTDVACGTTLDRALGDYVAARAHLPAAAKFTAAAAPLRRMLRSQASVTLRLEKTNVVMTRWELEENVYKPFVRLLIDQVVEPFLNAAAPRCLDYVICSGDVGGRLPSLRGEVEGFVVSNGAAARASLKPPSPRAGGVQLDESAVADPDWLNRAALVSPGGECLLDECDAVAVGAAALALARAARSPTAPRLNLAAADARPGWRSVRLDTAVKRHGDSTSVDIVSNSSLDDRLDGCFEYRGFQ